MFFFLAYLYSVDIHMGTCIQPGELFHSAGLHRNRCQPQLTREKIERGFGKHADEWTGRVEISKEEIPGSKRSKYDYITTSPGVEGRTFKALCSQQMGL